MYRTKPSDRMATDMATAPKKNRSTDLLLGREAMLPQNLVTLGVRGVVEELVGAAAAWASHEEGFRHTRS